MLCSTHKKLGSAGVRLQVLQLRQFPKLGGNVPVEIILGKASAHKLTRKEGKVSAVLQKMLYCNNNRIRDVGVAGFAYNSVSSITFPSWVGMAPTRLLS